MGNVNTLQSVKGEIVQDECKRRGAPATSRRIGSGGKERASREGWLSIFTNAGASEEADQDKSNQRPQSNNQGRKCDQLRGWPARPSRWLEGYHM